MVRIINKRCVNGTKEYTMEVDSSVPLTHHDPTNLGLICLVKQLKIRFRILSDLRIQPWVSLRKHTFDQLDSWSRVN